MIKIISRPIYGTVILTGILVLVGLIPWFWINSYLDRYAQAGVKNSYTQPVAEIAIAIEKEAGTRFKLLDEVYGNIVSGTYDDPANRSNAFIEDLKTLTATKSIVLEMSWFDPDSRTINYPDKGNLNASIHSIQAGTDSQLLKDTSNRWWLVKQKYVSDTSSPSRLVMAIPVEDVMKAATVGESPKFFNLALSSEDGTIVYGKDFTATADPILIPIYLDGLTLNFMAYPENGWAQLSKGTSLGFRWVGLFIIFGMAALVFLVLKRQEKLKSGYKKEGSGIGAGI